MSSELREAYDKAVEETDRNPLAHTDPKGWRISGSSVREIALSRKVIAAQDEQIAKLRSKDT